MPSPSLIETYSLIQKELQAFPSAHLIAVSKTQSHEKMKALYDLGQRAFGENYVQELVQKRESLPTDIQWHFIGHLQTNKVKYLSSFVHTIHTVDSVKLLNEIEKQVQKHNRIVDIFIQVNISKEANKSGIDVEHFQKTFDDIVQVIKVCTHVRLVGLMGMTSWFADTSIKEKEFQLLSNIFKKTRNHIDIPTFQWLSMGMSEDYPLALANGATHIRIGTKLFGARV